MRAIKSRQEEPGNAASKLGNPITLRQSFVTLCPHCRANGDLTALGSPDHSGPVVSRSDGKLFHLFAADRPVAYPHGKNSHGTEILSVGFWYVHEGNGPLTETTVVILRRPPFHITGVMRQIEVVADRLADLLIKTARLSCLYEFDGARLVSKDY
jgi:hypothetical protein